MTLTAVYCDVILYHYNTLVAVTFMPFERKGLHPFLLEEHIGTGHFSVMFMIKFWNSNRPKFFASEAFDRYLVGIKISRYT